MALHWHAACFRTDTIDPGTLSVTGVLRAAWRCAIAGGVWWLVGLAIVAGAGQASANPIALHLTAAERLHIDTPAAAQPAPAVQDSRALPGTWVPVSLPHTQPSDLLAQAAPGAPQRRRITWYRITVPAGDAGAGAGAATLALYAARTKGDGPIALYLDGRRVHQWQLDGPGWYWAPLWLPLGADPVADPATDLQPGLAALPREILFRFDHLRETRTALASVWVGDADALRWRWWVRDGLQVDLPATCAAAFLSMGLFALFVWLRRPAETGYLLFFALAVASAIRSLHFYVTWPVSNPWLAWLTVTSLFAMLLAVHFFQRGLQPRPVPWLTRSLIACSLGVAVVTLPWLPLVDNSPRLTPLIYLLVVPLSISMAWTGVAQAWRHSTEGMLVAGSVSLNVVLGGVDWLLQNNFIGPEGWYLGPYMTLVNFVVFCLLMYRRYIGALHDVEQANAQLAHRLLDREQALERSHAQLRDVEHRQTLSQERQRLMQDMHDGLGATLHNALRAFERGPLGGPAVGKILRNCIDDVHLTIDAMDPVEADLALLLDNLLGRVADPLQRAGVSLRWQVPDLPRLDWLDPRCALHILRILQEALTNATRHTQADDIALRAVADATGVTLHLCDNGPGFDLDQALHNGGRGLRNQLRRADAIGARLHWQQGAAAPGRAGTCVTLWLPLRRPAAVGPA